MSFSIVPAHLAVKAMRDNGYKNAAYAVAELMDNSIQATAKHVELLCAEQFVANAQRDRRRISQIGVLDDASGMDAETLRIALQFGNGTRLEDAQRHGIGRFGMGLPASSISQCQRVEVWTWQNGPDRALYSYLDLNEIISQNMTEIPEPEVKAVPKLWRDAGQNWGETGTLVVWSTLDRIIWKTALALIDNSEFVIGRMYRNFLKDGKVSIRLAAFDLERPAVPTIDRQARPNDPGYLMTETSTPAPWNDTPLFEPWGGDDFEAVHEIRWKGTNYPVTLRFSFAREEARQGHNPGARPYGRHAARNTGVSVVRAGRELELDESWASTSDPRDRWWGIEIEFPPALDEVFGVTNNKQHAHVLSEFAQLDFDDLLKDGSSLAQLREEWDMDDDPRAPLIEIANQIQKTRNTLRRLLAAQTASESRRGKRRHDESRNSPESRATEVTKARQEEGHTGRSDADESLPFNQRQEDIENELENLGVPALAAHEIAAHTVSVGLKYVFAEADLETSAFFSVKQKGGSILVTLNTNHPAYGSLLEVLERDASEDDNEELRRRLTNAADGLKLLLSAWARYEDEQPDGPRRNAAQETRADWGRLARQFMQNDG